MSKGTKDETKVEEFTIERLTAVEQILVEKYGEDVAAQTERLDRLAERLITLELAIPGLFATVLKLAAGREATVPLGTAFYVAFGCWLVALILAVFSLMPSRWQVDEEIMQQDIFERGSPLGIRDYFQQVPRFKRYLLLPSVFLFFGGIFSAALSVL